MIINLDFEASGLEPDSYPIQVAWNIGETVNSFLINPETADGWTWWSMAVMWSMWRLQCVSSWLVATYTRMQSSLIHFGVSGCLKQQARARLLNGGVSGTGSIPIVHLLLKMLIHGSVATGEGA